MSKIVLRSYDRLVSASASGDLDSVTTLLRLWKPMKNGDQRMELILDVAVKNQHFGVISYLLDKEEPVTRVHTRSAVHAQSVKTLQMFLDHGWDINNRWYPYTMPTIRSCSVSVRWKPGLTLARISEAIRLNNLELVKWFLAHGATPRLDSTEFTYRTPLTDAVNYASIDIVKLLVANGAEVNHGNLLHELCESSCPSRLEILDYLISQGAPVNQFEEASNPRLSECSNQFGIGTPLHNAAKCNNLAMAKALLSHGADPRLQDNRCWTPLGWAKTLGEARMIELLEEACPNASWYCSSASENRPSASEIRLSASENQSSASEYLLGSSDDWSSASD